jgi:sugar lactone lactonase YvrE
MKRFAQGMLAVAALAISNHTHAAINAGDILVTDDRDQTAAPGRLIKIDPATGTQALVSEGGLLRWPYGVAMESATTVVVADYGADAIIRVNLSTGAQTPLSSGGGFRDPIGITVDNQGTIYVADNSARAVFRVDAVTGAQTTVSSRGLFQKLRGVVAEAGGTLVVTDQGANAVIRINLGVSDDGAGSNQSVVSSGGSFTQLKGIALDAQRRILVADDSGVYRVDAQTGQQTLVIASGNGLTFPYTVEPDAQQQLLVVDPAGGGAPGSLFRVDPSTGSKVLVSTGGYLESPLDIAIVPTQDSDGDGVPDDRDLCPNTPSAGAVDANGCSINQLVPCAGPWRNHGAYVSAIAKKAEQFLEQGLITEDQKDAIVEVAAQSDCGKDR